MSKLSSRGVPSDVYALLLDYWTRRTAVRWLMTSKQNPTSPLDRLCAQLLAARHAVELFRDELIRVNAGVSTQERLEELKADLAISFMEMWAWPYPDKSDPDHEGLQLIGQAMDGKVWDYMVRYANLDMDRVGSFAELFLCDAGKLSAVAVALNDAEEAARTVLPMMARDLDGESDDAIRDHATAWLIREWRERFPKVSRKSIARWLHQLDLEPSTPAKIEDRLRKAEQRRRQKATTGRERPPLPPASTGRKRKPGSPSSTGHQSQARVPSSGGR